MKIKRIIELLEIEKECVLRNATAECNRYCAGCDLLQDDTELHEMYTEAIALLKAQEPRAMADTELEAIRKAPLILKPNVDAVPVVRCRDCKHWWKVNELCTHQRHVHGTVCAHECKAMDYCSDGERRDDDAADRR